MKDVLKKIIKFDFTPTIIFYVLFMVLTGLLVYVDTQPVGWGKSMIGLASINRPVFDFIGKSLLWYNITEILGKIAIVYMVGFAIYGLVQWVDRHKLKRVDKDLFVLAFIYVLIAVCYVIFEIFIVNFRPVLVNIEPEASYPSSHTMLVVCVMATSIMQFHSKMKKKALRIVMEIVSAIIMVVTVVGRLLSGVHWLTDILGALLLSATLISFYYALVKRNNKYGKSISKKKKTKKIKSNKEIREKRKAKRVEKAKKRKKVQEEKE